MAPTKPHSFDNKTSLVGRELTHSGVSIVKPSEFDPPTPELLSLLAKQAIVRTTHITPVIDEYNQYAPDCITLPSSIDFECPIPKFVVPKRYTGVVIDYLEGLLIQDCASNPASSTTRVDRHDAELEWFVSHNKVEMLGLMMYIVEQLENHSIPWGVGRGSSVNSYIFYLLGVHDIDPIKYDLDWEEFLRD